MNDLETRVLNAIPAAAFEMNALLSLLRIEETEDVPTASVSCERRPVLQTSTQANVTNVLPRQDGVNTRRLARGAHVN